MHFSHLALGHDIPLFHYSNTCHSYYLSKPTLLPIITFHGHFSLIDLSSVSSFWGVLTEIPQGFIAAAGSTSGH